MEGPREDETVSYEEAFNRLQGVVTRLEGGETTLDETLALFEEGVKLARWCVRKLDAAEGKVEELLEEGGTLLRRPFFAEGVANGGTNGGAGEEGP